MSAEAVKVLRKAVSRPKIDEGTAVRFVVQFQPDGKQYTYAALFVNRSWYTTAVQQYGECEIVPRGTLTIRPRMTNAQFEEALRDERVLSVEVATEWTLV